ncbi:hypothetical protein DFH07DRAFT_809424 [Mycena maculata]|uniref:Uncharacterized protein n=1 Tax=Mycena maculata TaxID=230809 RepID=A0AAD7JMS3_9AGAR|nr:hypothetical protein DFH07DRAFT_809424 [Mycena maculata]
MARTELTAEDSLLITELCNDVLFHKNLEWMDEGGLKESITRLWETAAAVGFRQGKEEAKATAERERNVVTRQMEQERVWGFDVGWKLCCELQQLPASQASLVTSPPSPCSVSVAATQTDAVAVTPVVIVATPTPAAAIPAPTPAPLDWAEDAATLPIVPLHSAPSPSTPRDFSALRTGSPQPFASLQRRRRRSPRPPTSQQHHSNCRPRKPRVPYAANRRTPPSSIHVPAPTSFPPSDKPATKFPLDWDQDPRLRDLGQALAALGWVRL